MKTRETKEIKMTRNGVKTKQNPQLKQRELTGGKTALYLEYYLGRDQKPRLDENGLQMYYPAGTAMAGKPMFVVKHIRRKEELKLYLISKPRTPEEREKNKETKILAEKIRQEKEQELLNDTVGYRIDSHKNDNIITFFEGYLEDYTKKDRRNIALAINRFKTFLREYRPASATKKTTSEIAIIDADWAEKHKGIHGRHEINENCYYRFSLKPAQLNIEMVKHFKDYLIEHSDGEGAATAFARFKKIVKYAHEKGMLRVNPCEGISRPKVDKDVITKDVLTSDEISALINTHYEGENPEIRNAFLLSLFTGVRWCDVKELRFSNVDYSASTLKFTQKKTEGHSAHAYAEIPLKNELLKLIGTPEEKGKGKEDLIFTLPSHTMALKALRHWTNRAGIDKSITWHCARHSFATNILTNGANVRIVAELLGHSGLQYVTRYARAVDEAKRQAIDSLPEIKL